MSPAPTVERDSDRVVEIRVHGIGDHQLWSSLGRANILEEDADSGAAVVEPPLAPVHRVHLFNWSRVTRRVFRVLWYLAFPFTLINLAHHMRPVGSRPAKALHMIFVHFASVALTILTTVWVLLGCERVALFLGRDELLGMRSPQLFFWLGAALLSVTPLARAARSETVTHLRTGVVHACIVAGTAVMIFAVEPDRTVLEDDSYFIAHASYGPNRQGLADLQEHFRSGPPSDVAIRVEQVPFLDAVGLVSYFCVFSVLALACLVALTSWGQKDERVASPLAGAAAAVTLAMLLGLLSLTAVFRSLPVLVDPLLRRLPDGPGFRSLDPGTRLLPMHGPSSASVALPLVALVLLALLVCILLAGARFRPAFFLRPALEGLRRRLPILRNAATNSDLRSLRLARMRWSHDVVTRRLPMLLATSLVVFIAAIEAVGFLLITYLNDRADRDRSQWFIEYLGGTLVSAPQTMTLGDRGVAAGVSASVAVGLWVVTRGASGPLQKILANVGDVAGFWPITVSPFGGRSYRNSVVKALDKVVTNRGRSNVVLVGHSQGSVLAAWYSHASAPPLSGDGVPSDVLRGLITCGSPLRSLYGRFFPATFTPAFFTGVRRGCGGWENFWRETDPIATPIGAPCDDHAALPDPRPAGDGRLSGHSDYWLEDAQRGAAGRLVVSGGALADGQVDRGDRLVSPER